MYTVSKGPSKIVAKTRRGICSACVWVLGLVYIKFLIDEFLIIYIHFTGLSQNLERLDSRKDHNRKSSESDNGEIIK